MMRAVLSVFVAQVVLVAKAKMDNDGLVDLSHTFVDGIGVWPTLPRYNQSVLSKGPWAVNPDVYVYLQKMELSEHTGTHMDAPSHFTEGGKNVDEIEIGRFRAPAFVIDVTEQVAGNKDYQMTVDDIKAFEAKYGQIEENGAVIMRTGFHKFFGDAAKYFGSTEADASKFHYPSLAPAAAQWLVAERRPSVFGVDAISLDGPPHVSAEAGTHRALLNNGVLGLENLANLDKLPPTGAMLYSFPLKIGKGSGGPTRVFADLINGAKPDQTASMATCFMSSFFTAALAAFFCL